MKVWQDVRVRPWNDRDVLASVFGRAVLEQAAAVLAPAGIRLMPLKGLWLQHAVYPEPAARRITDVDALVLEPAYEPAVERLLRAGWSCQSSSIRGAALVVPGMPLPLDLHRRLFTRFAFNMPTEEVFARGHLDDRTFDATVVMPDPLDGFAHLLGHFVKSRGETGTERIARDLVLTAQTCSLLPSAIAAHLTLTGLGRAARYALAIAAEVAEAQPLCREILGCLPNDPVGDLLARRLLRLRGSHSSRSVLGALPGFALERTLLRGGRSLVVRWADRRHDRRTVP